MTENPLSVEEAWAQYDECVIDDHDAEFGAGPLSDEASESREALLSARKAVERAVLAPYREAIREFVEFTIEDSDDDGLQCSDRVWEAFTRLRALAEEGGDES